MRVVGMILLSVLLYASQVYAGIDVYEFDDARQDQQFHSLVKELRCPKCQNQSISDSNAPLAHDIKDRVYDLVKQGKSDDEITAFMVDRYGEFVTYRPRLSLGTLFLWLAPALGGLLALLLVFLRARQNGKAQPPQASNDRQLQTLLDKYDDRSSGK